jgi:arylsulfatase A
LKEAGIYDDTMIVFTSDNGPEKTWEGRIDEFGHHRNGSYKDGKRSIYEGGHRVPFFVRWPGGIKKQGRRYDGLVGQTDLLATVAEIAGATLPKNAGEDSERFASVLLRRHSPARRSSITLPMAALRSRMLIGN